MVSSDYQRLILIRRFCVYLRQISSGFHWEQKKTISGDLRVGGSGPVSEPPSPLFRVKTMQGDIATWWNYLFRIIILPHEPSSNPGITHWLLIEGKFGHTKLLVKELITKLSWHCFPHLYRQPGNKVLIYGVIILSTMEPDLYLLDRIIISM